MDQDVTKSELAVWHEALGDEAKRLSQPDTYYGELMAHAEVMRHLGMIDTHQWIELRDLALSAYSHAIEEAITAKINDYGEVIWPT